MKSTHDNSESINNVEKKQLKYFCTCKMTRVLFTFE